jgi:hypothetical protein
MIFPGMTTTKTVGSSPRRQANPFHFSPDRSPVRPTLNSRHRAGDMPDQRRNARVKELASL